IKKGSKNLHQQFGDNRCKNEFYRAIINFQRQRLYRPLQSVFGLATWGARFYFYQSAIISNKIAFHSEYELNGFFGQLAPDYKIKYPGFLTTDFDDFWTNVYIFSCR